MGDSCTTSHADAVSMTWLSSQIGPHAKLASVNRPKLAFVRVIPHRATFRFRRDHRVRASTLDVLRLDKISHFSLAKSAFWEGHHLLHPRCTCPFKGVTGSRSTTSPSSFQSIGDETVFPAVLKSSRQTARRHVCPLCGRPSLPMTARVHIQGIEVCIRGLGPQAKPPSGCPYKLTSGSATGSWVEPHRLGLQLRGGKASVFGPCSAGHPGAVAAPLSLHWAYALLPSLLTPLTPVRLGTRRRTI